MFRATAISNFHNVVGGLANLVVLGWLRLATFDQRNSPVMEAYSRQATALSRLPLTDGPSFRHAPSYFLINPEIFGLSFLLLQVR